MRKKYKILIIVTLLLLLLCIIYIETIGFITNKEINEFVSRGIYQCTINDIEYYKVIKEYDYENTSDRIVDKVDDNYVGTTGDIYITSKDPLDFFVSEYISNNIRIGHSCIVSDEHAKNIIEIFGNAGKNNNVVKENENNWHDKNMPEMIVLRVKGFDEESKSNLLKELHSIYNKKYNYFFLFHMENRYYCTDLCSRSYKSIGYNIDDGAIMTSGSSMIKDDDTYLIYYKKRVNKNGIKYKVYYLCEE